MLLNIIVAMNTNFMHNKEDGYWGGREKSPATSHCDTEDLVTIHNNCVCSLLCVFFTFIPTHLILFINTHRHHKHEPHFVYVIK